MKKVLRWIGIALGLLVALVVVAAVALSAAGGAQFTRTVAVEVAPIPIPTDEAALARGEHIVRNLCTSCHGEPLTGGPVFVEPGIAAVYAANITGLTETRSDLDLVRAIRHGLAPDGRRLVVMPSDSFVYFSAEDLGSIIAYLKTVPRAGGEVPRSNAEFMGRILLSLGMFGEIFPAELVDHQMPFPPMPAVGPTVEYGRYLAGLCLPCHGPGLRGGQPPFPDFPPAPDLAVVGGWSEAGFLQLIDTGITPDGREINPEYMPFESLAKLDEDELRGLYLYLHSLP